MKKQFYISRILFFQILKILYVLFFWGIGIFIDYFFNCRPLFLIILSIIAHFSSISYIHNKVETPDLYEQHEPLNPEMGDQNVVKINNA